jgi:hypothetical protein
MIQNMPASVHQRLLNYAKENSRPFLEVLQYYCIERFLHRLSLSKYNKDFILKGALLLIAWRAPLSRTTKDIDMLSYSESDTAVLENIVREIFTQKVKPDGLKYDPATVKGEQIIEQNIYPGVRITFMGYLGRSKTNMQIDFGFGDKVYPKTEKIDYPSLLGTSDIKLVGYPLEAFISEKLQIMYDLGMINSRMKDFYDVWLIARQYNFKGKILKKAIVTTFKSRDTELMMNPVCFTDKFIAEKDIHWKSFLKRNGIEDTPKDLKKIIILIKRLIKPIIKAANRRVDFEKIWTYKTGWK